ncbi:MAG: ribonucleoside triphosphate reductase [Vampirovibrionales bacterium]|nr:ribonucleoside triphosphate reductase [Vampirovibrionales bacterium]
MVVVTLLTRVKKRNGDVVAFDPRKITAALTKAGQASGEMDAAAAEKLAIRAMSILQTMFERELPSVEDIQDVVEEVLLGSPYKKTAKAYILYREQHTRMRELISSANVDLMDNYLACLDWQVNENSNMAYSLQGLNNYIASEVSKTYWLSKIYPAEVRQAHEGGDLHLHDLNQLSVYCVGWDLKDLLTQGFTGVSGKMESRPARHFRTALGQIVNFFYTLQGEAAGAQAFANFDTFLAPYIRYDGLSYDEVKQALQEFVFNVNVPTRVGFQTPFTNITMDVKCPSMYANEPVIRGGAPQEETYGEFQVEMDMLNQAFMEVMMEGDAKGRVFTFPIPTYNIGRDFDWGNPQLERLWEVTARYGIAYFANFVNSEMSPEDARSMCCRLRLDTRTLDRRGGGLFGANPLTGSIGVVTINLPRIGYVSKSRQEFFQRLDGLMEIAKNSLEIKRKMLETLTDKNLYPYTKFYLRAISQRFGKYWNNHFSTIGLVGMNEACLNLLGVGIDDESGKRFAEDVLDYMRERMQAFQEETGNLYNLEATPAEGTSYRLARLDRKKFPKIRFANTAAVARGAEPFYTNSSHVPVNYTEDIFELLDHQDDLQAKYTGGTVVHVFVGEEIRETGSVKAFVKKVCENYRLPYFTISPTFSVCPSHGYRAGQHALCPQCGATSEVYSRVVGYLRPVEQWNVGKQAEFEMRKTFMVDGASFTPGTLSDFEIPSELDWERRAVVA